jgi:hypothetical protein
MRIVPSFRGIARCPFRPVFMFPVGVNACGLCAAAIEAASVNWSRATTILEPEVAILLKKFFIV